MKKTLYFFSFYTLLLFGTLKAQTISVATSCGPQSINFSGIQNSRNSYNGTTPGNGFHLKIFWDANTSRWVTQGWQGAYDINYTSSLNTSPNPPSFSTGNWISYGFSGFCPLTGLSGNGTTSINVAVAVTDAACGSCNDGTALATPSGSVAPYVYSWSPSGGNAAIATNLSPGNYVVTVTGADNNSIQKNITIGNVLATSESQQQSNVSVFPTRAKDFITINSDIKTLTKTELYDSTGKKVMDIVLKDSATQVDVSGLSTGMYFLKLQTKEGIKIQKIIKQ
jgi:hypothetical protein